ncbi:MAG TPA: RsmE family RNA methyltransferase [Bryobacteraceae bacterium]|nr:RsmE family RNA methyltransferase [Bryobacteraceae bacterium]
MARRRFFIPEVRRGLAELTGADAEHLVRVLRVEAGQVFELSDNHSVYLAEIESARKSGVTFRVLKQLPSEPASVSVTLLPALFKFDRFEWLVEKATELGVTAIQPCEAARTERGLAAASAKRTPRWQKIASEASQQSRRTRLPMINQTFSLAKALQLEGTVRLLLDEASSAKPILEVIPIRRTSEDRVLLMLGPEGGWTDGERAEAVAAGWTACSLGPTVLRAETAGIAGLAVIRAAWLFAH